ncbi:MAG: Mu-like prophage major head subunit gpT family protein [Patescibacteria group bacterium]
MTINSDTIKNITLGFQAIFYNALIKAQVFWPEIATEVLATKKKMEYPFLGDIPQVSEWVAERQKKVVGAYKITLSDKKYEDTLRVNREDIEDDNLGLYKPIIQMFGIAHPNHQDKLAFELFKNSFSDKAYDNVEFCGTHSWGTNKGTTALSETAIDEAVAAMQSFKTDEGEFLMVNPTHLIVPPKLYGTAIRCTESLQLITGENATKGNLNVVSKYGLKVIKSPYLTDTNNWWLADCSKPIKPFIMQVRIPPEFESDLDLNAGGGSQKFEADILSWGTRSRYNAGYMWPQLVYGSEVA